MSFERMLNSAPIRTAPHANVQQAQKRRSFPLIEIITLFAQPRLTMTRCVTVHGGPRKCPKSLTNSQVPEIIDE